MHHIKQYDFYHELRSLPFVEAIWLYGSRARGDYQERSDIDMAIFCPRASADEWREIRRIIDCADTLLKIDAVRLDTLSDAKLKHAIETDKVILFERKATSIAWYESFLDLGEAIERLEEMVNEPEHRVSYVRDATIQRFEFCVELFWKILKKICIDAGLEANSPRQTLQQAYAMKLLDDETTWLDMIEDQNLTSHAYNLSAAREIYQHAKSHYAVMAKTYLSLKHRFSL